MKLYVGNLPYNISDDQLQAMFAKFGTPDSARVITDRDTGQSKGFGFVEFSNDEMAKRGPLAQRHRVRRPFTQGQRGPSEERGGGGGGGRGRY